MRTFYTTFSAAGAVTKTSAKTYTTVKGDPSSVSTFPITSPAKSDEMVYTCVLTFDDTMNVPNYYYEFDLIQVFRKCQNLSLFILLYNANPPKT